MWQEETVATTSRLTTMGAKGMASLEAVTLSFVLVVVLTYIWGVFGVIHTGIVNSIAARAYAFETFRNRANLIYLRDGLSPFDQANGAQLPAALAISYKKFGFRIHGIHSEFSDPNDLNWEAATRKLAFNESEAPIGDSSDIHGKNLNAEMGDVKSETALVTKQNNRVNPVWIKTMYGICLYSSCGGS